MNRNQLQDKARAAGTWARKNWRTIAIVVGLLLLATALAGCGSLSEKDLSTLDESAAVRHEARVAQAIDAQTALYAAYLANATKLFEMDCSGAQTQVVQSARKDGTPYTLTQPAPGAMVAPCFTGRVTVWNQNVAAPDLDMDISAPTNRHDVAIAESENRHETGRAVIGAVTNIAPWVAVAGIAINGSNNQEKQHSDTASSMQGHGTTYQVGGDGVAGSGSYSNATDIEVNSGTAAGNSGTITQANKTADGGSRLESPGDDPDGSVIGEGQVGDTDNTNNSDNSSAPEPEPAPDV